MSKVADIYEKLKQTSVELANGSWPDFLRTAAWNYKYSFPNQTLIYAQRPDATACASMEDWNRKLHRRIRPRAAGIALLEESNVGYKLNYVFDVKDTQNPYNVPLPLWNMTGEKEEDVRIALAEAFLPGSHPYRDDFMAPSSQEFFHEIARNIYTEMCVESEKELQEIKGNCEVLRDMEDWWVTNALYEVIVPSVASIMMYRCGMQPTVDTQAVDTVRAFTDLQAMALLGQTIQKAAFEGLEVARRAVRKYDREHKEELNHAHESQLSSGGRVSNPGSETSGREASEQVRQDAQSVSEGAPTQPVHPDADVRGADVPSEQRRGPDAGTGIPADDGAAQEKSLDRPNDREPELQDVHGADPEAGRGDGLSGDDLRIDEDPLPDAASEGFHVEFTPSEEQTAIIGAELSELVPTQDEIENILNTIADRHAPDAKVIDVFAEEPNSREAISALQEAYGKLNDVFEIYPDSKIIKTVGKPYGIEVFRLSDVELADLDNKYIIPWTDLGKTISQRIAQKEAEKANTPDNSDALKEGQTITLTGKNYLVKSVSPAFVTLQDAKYPIFTNTLPRATLDLLLNNSNNQKAEQTKEPEPPQEQVQDAVQAQEPVKEAEPEVKQDPMFPTPFPITSREWNRIGRDYRSEHADGSRTIMMNQHGRTVVTPVVIDDENGLENKTYLFDEVGLGYQVSAYSREEALEIIKSSGHFMHLVSNLRLKEEEREAPEQTAEPSPAPESDQSREDSHSSISSSLDAPEQPIESLEQNAEPAPSVIAVQPQYIHQILRYNNSEPHTWSGLTNYFSEHLNPEDRIEYLKEHFGNVFTSLFAENEPDKYIGFHGSEDSLEIWEDNYLSTETRGFLPWEDVCRRVEQELASDLIRNAPAEVPTEVQSAPETTPEGRQNFRITDMNPNYGGPKARFQGNIAAIKLLKDLEAEDRLATPEEQEILSHYVGWGGIPEAFDESNRQWHKEYTTLKDLLTEDEYQAARESTLTAFYTPPVVTEAIYAGLEQLGFKGGNVLDPCCATGNFFGMLPDSMSDSRLYGVELDAISGRIGRQLYQNANIVIDGYERTSLPDSMFDVAVGNVPFGNFQLRDKRYDKEHFLIHDYFFAKTLDKVRPGGVVAFVTSRGTMDKEDDSVRRYIAHRADLLGAIRLPDNTFKSNAGTEVTSDILFLKKRERPSIEEPYWVGLDSRYDFQSDTWSPSYNAYFVDHPEMVLGKMVEVSGPHGPTLTCKAKRGEDLRTALQRAVKNIEGSIGDLSAGMEALDAEANPRDSIPAVPDVRNFSFTIVDGDIYFREDSLMFRCDLNKTAEQRVKGLVNLRDITRDLIQSQVENAPDEEILALQSKLNDAYDAFTAKHGIINSRGNSMAFSDDSSYFLLCSLENLDNEGNFESKADIFTKRTIGQHSVPEHVETAQEALVVSLSERAAIDLKYMSSLSNISEEKLVEDLQGLIFPVPGNPDRYEISNLYLSGNVREKLREAQIAAEEGPRFKTNVEYLEKAIPEPLEAGDISVRLGATWIPASDYRDFLLEFLQIPEWSKSYLDVIYEPHLDSWSISNKNMVPAYSHILNHTYGTSRIGAVDILEKTLNLKDVQIFDTQHDYSTGTTQRVLNVSETLAAQEKQQAIKDGFKEWIWQGPDRRDRLCQLYNEKFNSVVTPSFSEDMVQFHGLNPMIELAPHQKESVARILFSGNTLLAHVVGAGKTWTMTAAAMEGKYLGLCQKSLIVVPNHLIGQWAAAIYDAYPQANVLASTEKDFTPANRKKFCSRIATGDYDIVVIGHSHFEKIPLSPERQEAGIQKELDAIIDAIRALKAEKGEHLTIKKLEAAKKTLSARLDKLHNSKKKDDVVTFEELGVDRLFVDESHNYKNLYAHTKMSNVAGINQTDSQKASDMFLKCRYMDELTGNMGNIHATGTPVSNTMVEIFTNQRYLQYDMLQKLGLTSLDSWASTFGETVVALELAPEGNGYRTRTRFAKFFNVPELMNLFKQVADIRTKDMLNLPVPAVEYKTEVLKPSQEQVGIVQNFGERAERIRNGGVDRTEDNMLCITNEGRKVALDQRLIDPSLPDNPNSKTNRCAQNIYDIYKKGDNDKLTQLVFCDLSTPNKYMPMDLVRNEDGVWELPPGAFTDVYNDLKAKLVAMGIPEDEIRFIHEANTTAQKEALFAKVRSGDVRILMGSTGKMGTGTNVQTRLAALHHLDAPWRPSDLDQRDGRGVRRGNENDTVQIFRYVTESTFDAYMYQLLEIKQRFTDQIMSSRNPARCIDDIDGAALDYAEIKALSSGDTRIKEKVTLEMEISKLETLKTRHVNENYRFESDIRILPMKIQGVQERLRSLQDDNALVSSSPSRTEGGKLIPAAIKGVTYEKSEDAGKAIMDSIRKLRTREEWEPIGTLRGFQIQGMLKEIPTASGSASLYPQISVCGKCRYNVEFSDSAQGLMTRLNNVLDYRIDERIKEAKIELSHYEMSLRDAKEAVGKPFPDEDVLQEKKVRLAELDAELNLDSKDKDEPSRGEDDVEVLDSSTGSKKQSLNDMIADASTRAGCEMRDGRNLEYAH